MKRILLALVAIIALLGLAGVGTAHAIDARSGNNATIGKDEVLDSSAYITGSNVTVAGIVKGDLYCAGQNIDITGTIEGDVLCGGQTVRIGGTVRGDVRAAGQTVTITGAIEGAVTLAGQTTTIAEGAVISRDATVMGSNTFIAGKVERDLVGAGDQVTIAGHVGRNTDLSTQQVTLQKTGHIGGNLIYVSPNNAAMQAGAKVDGRSERQDPPKHERQEQTMLERYMGGPIYWLFAFFLIGLVVMAVAPKALDEAATTLRKRPLIALASGAASFFAVPILAFLSLLTIIGIPLAFMLLAVWFPLVMIGFVAGAYCAGALVVKKLGWSGWQRTLSLFIGALLIMIISIIPIIGGFAFAVTMIWGIGSLLVLWVQHVQGAKHKYSKKTA